MQKFHGSHPLLGISTEPSIWVHVWHTVWSWSKCSTVRLITSKAFCIERFFLCPRCGPPLKKGKTRIFHGLHQVWTLWFCMLVDWYVKFVLTSNFMLSSLLCLYVAGSSSLFLTVSTPVLHCPCLHSLLHSPVLPAPCCKWRGCEQVCPKGAVLWIAASWMS